MDGFIRDLLPLFGSQWLFLCVDVGIFFCKGLIYMVDLTRDNSTPTDFGIFWG